MRLEGNVTVYKGLNLEMLLKKAVKECNYKPNTYRLA